LKNTFEDCKRTSVTDVNCTELKWSNNWITERFSKPTNASV